MSPEPKPRSMAAVTITVNRKGNSYCPEAVTKSGYMLEHPSISQYLRPNEGDNLWSADNQQERLVRIGWILGFIDGEGCFSIGFRATTPPHGSPAL